MRLPPPRWCVLRRRIAYPGALLFSVAAACNGLDPTFAVPGIIVLDGETARITAPDSVARGAPLRCQWRLLPADALARSPAPKRR